MSRWRKIAAVTLGLVAARRLAGGVDWCRNAGDDTLPTPRTGPNLTVTDIRDYEQLGEQLGEAERKHAGARVIGQPEVCRLTSKPC